MRPRLPHRRLAVAGLLITLIGGAATMARPAVTVAATSPFTDIAGSTFESDIDWLYAEGITVGCQPTQYCPDLRVTRAQMASFLVRMFDLTEGAAVDAFVDDEGISHEADINRLAYSGITHGCAGPDSTQFCPKGHVTRGEMASFLARAIPVTDGAGDNYFRDDDGTTHEGDIDRIAAAGITDGCDVWRFCPAASITRGEMAAFLHRVTEPIAVPPHPAPGPSTMFVTIGGDDADNSCLVEAGPCRTIKRAITQAVDGDVVDVGPGTYVDGDMRITVDVTIRGVGDGGTVIDASGAGRDPIFRVLRGSLELDGMIVQGYRGDDGAIEVSGAALSIVDSTLTDNRSAANGGAIGMFMGTLQIEDSTLTNNHAAGHGGAIDGSGQIEIRGTTISGNSAGYTGGAISYAGPISGEPGVLRVTNSTLSGNHAVDGGAVATGFDAPFWLINSTITGNIADRFSGGIDSRDARLRNSIVAGNDAFEDPDAVGVTSSIASIIGVPTGLTLADILDPAGLADNGGPTQTVALVDTAENPAIDNGSNTVCTAADLANGVDQRGLPRSVPCDIGAFEVQP